MLNAFCMNNCGDSTKITYEYNISTSTQVLDALSGQSLTEYAVNLTNIQSNSIKLELSITTSENATGTFSMLALINQVPTSGECTVSPLNGTTSNTDFTITCSNWTDPDGQIAKYTYFANFLNDQAQIGLGYSWDGILTTQLPQGAVYDSNRVYISVEVKDNDNGRAYYTCDAPITVRPNEAKGIQSLMSDLVSQNVELVQNRILSEGSSVASVQTLLSVAYLLNQQSLSDKKALNITNSSYLLTESYSYLNKYELFEASAIRSQQEFDSNRNWRSNTRDSLAPFLSRLSISDVDSIRSQASMLTMLTSQSDEMSRNLADAVTSQCVQLSASLRTLSAKSSLEEVKKASVALVSAIGNVNSGLSNYLNGRESFLSSDYRQATQLPEYYDTDLENYWTNPTNFQAEDKNTHRQKFQVVDTSQTISSMLDSVVKLVSPHLTLGNTLNIEAASISMHISKLRAQDLLGEIIIEGAKFAIPIPILNEILGGSQEITVKSSSSPISTSGFNGNNESFIGLSSCVELTFYDSKLAAMGVKDLKSPIEIEIPRQSLPPQNSSFQYVNATNMKIASNFHFMYNSFSITSTNASVHIQIRPLDLRVAYLVVVKFGYATNGDYDQINLLCPNSSKIFIF